MDTRLLPHECRERGISYTAPMTAYLAHQVNDGEVVVTERRLGQLPIMVGSNRCHLSRMTPEERVRCGEEVYELGGYFICNGLERLIRFLQVPRRLSLWQLIVLPSRNEVLPTQHWVVNSNVCERINPQ